MFKKIEVGELCKKLNVDERKYHTIIKPRIIKDFNVELKKKNIKNPDVSLDLEGMIFLADPQNSKKYVTTNLGLESYKD